MSRKARCGKTAFISIVSFSFSMNGVSDQVGSITFQELDDYGHHLDTVPGKRGRTASPAYKNKALQVSLFFLNWSSCRGHTLVDFSRYQLPQKVRMKPVEVPSVEQILKLLEAPDSKKPSGQRDRLILESFYTLGSASPRVSPAES